MMLGKTEQIILTAGPSISSKEVEYVVDATINGWNHHHSDYIRKFEDAFAQYIGVKHAMVTSSCTGALHLALLAMGIGSGDEVIVPETTWIATVSAVEYVGATPIFADIDPDTWVMDVHKIESLITKRTKVILPVHLYGNPVEMGPLCQIAEKYDLDILEDAAPSIGAMYDGKRTGSFGRAAAFSFQGAKAFVTGEGGILVSNDNELMERARLIGDHGRDPNRAFWNIRIGHKYKMSNIQAALGLAQIERADEIVAKKRQIFKWYQERLSDIPDIKLNVEKPWAYSLYWMSSMVLGDTYSISRDEFMKRLKERNIDTRPFFYPISSMPMYCERGVVNPVAYSVPLRAVNLPSGHERTEEEIDYICAHIRDILGANQGRIQRSQPHGWLAYRDRVFRIIRDYREGKECIDIMNSEAKIVGKLRPLTAGCLCDDSLLTRIVAWDNDVKQWYKKECIIEHFDTKKWLAEILEESDRIFFFIEDQLQTKVGFLSLSKFNFLHQTCEIDRFVFKNEDIIYSEFAEFVCGALMNWMSAKLEISAGYVRIGSDNVKMLELFEKFNYKEIQRSPLELIRGIGGAYWGELIEQPYVEVKRYLCTLKKDFEVGK